MSILGPDVSFYQDDPNTVRQIDFHAMRNHGARFVIIRGGQNNWTDPDFAFNWAGAKEAGLPRGSYWYYDSRVEPRLQAERWINQFGGDLGELPLFGDFEENYNGPYQGWQNWRLFLERLKQLAPGKMIGIYTAFYYWRDNTIGADLEYFHQYPLWIANYAVEFPAVPQPWSATEWMFWQYTSSGDGHLYGAESAEIDLNYFNGDEAHFQAILTNIELPPPPPAPEEIHLPDMYPGIDFHKVFRFNSWCCAIISRNQIYKVTKFGQKTVSTVSRETGAPIVFNGGAYDAHGAIGLHVSEGVMYSEQDAYEPFANANAQNRFSIYKYNEPAAKFNALAGKRMIVENGQVSPNTSAAWYETHPRTLDGVGLYGERIQVTVDGRQPGYSEGVDLFEAAAIMIEFGAVRATDKDGGGSTALAINGEIVNRPIDGNIPGKERAVGTHDLIFLAGTTPPPPDNGGTMATVKGTARSFTNLKYMDGVGLTGLGLQAGDWVLGDRSSTGSDIINITDGIHRKDGVTIDRPPLNKPCKASTGNLDVTDLPVSPPPPPPPPPGTTTYTVTLVDDQTGETWSGTLTKQ